MLPSDRLFYDVIKKDLEKKSTQPRNKIAKKLGKKPPIVKRN